MLGACFQLLFVAAISSVRGGWCIGAVQREDFLTLFLQILCTARVAYSLARLKDKLNVLFLLCLKDPASFEKVSFFERVR